MLKEGVNRTITMEELKEHSGPAQPWFVVAGEVYDGTGFLKDHPGGGDSITLVAGEDATEDFMAIHSPQGKKQLAAFHIGTLEKKAVSNVTVNAAAEIEPIFLNKTKWKKGKLVDVEVVSHDSRVFRFALEKPEQALGLPIGQHVFVRLRRKVKRDGLRHDEVVVDGEMIQRAYTPVSLSDAKGEIDLLIKLYLAGTNNLVGGKMTTSVPVRFRDILAY
jgi:nitrate reductase (NAD(P)H)